MVQKGKNITLCTNGRENCFILIFVFRSAWFTFDVGVNIIPTAYTIRHARGYGRYFTFTIIFQIKSNPDN